MSITERPGAQHTCSICGNLAGISITNGSLNGVQIRGEAWFCGSCAQDPRKLRAWAARR